MKQRTLVVALIGALAAGSVVGGTTIALAQDNNIVKQRQDNRKEAGATMRAIKGVIDAKGDVKTLVASAAKLKQLEMAFDQMFPKGSDKDTKALPTVWSDPAGFAAASKNADTAYDNLAKAAGSGDLAAVTAAFGETSKACGACHDKFRAKAN